jgi:hypothetical protein
MECLKLAARPDGWKIGNTNRTADALLHRGLIEILEYHGWSIIYRATAAGIELLRPGREASEAVEKLFREKASPK